MKRLIFGCMALLLLVSSVQQTSFGQDQDPPEKLNEQTVYIPFEELREVFERDGRGVFIPYDQFQKLWKAARESQTEPPPAKAPLGALVTEIDSVATLGNEIVAVDAQLKIELLTKGWHRIPLRLQGAAIRSATIDDSEAKLTTDNKGQYYLLIEHRGDEAETTELELSYARSLTKNGAQSTVAFQAPQAPVNRWTVRTAEKDLDVQIAPMIASSRREPEEDRPGEEILAFVGTAPTVSVTWTPKAEGASGLSALVSANTQSRLQIDPGVARRSSRSRFVFPRIRKWSACLTAMSRSGTLRVMTLARWSSWICLNRPWGDKTWCWSWNAMSKKLTKPKLIRR